MPIITSSTKRDNLNSSILISISFISFSYLITLAKISSATLNESHVSEPPYFIADLSGNI
jgi:hypothetical protein